MALPKAIERQAQEAAVLEQNIQNAPVVQNVMTDPSQLTSPPPTPAAPPANVDPPSTPAQPTSTESELAHKLRTLQGKYSAEIGPLQRQLAEAQRLIQDLNRRLTETPKKPEPPKQAEKPEIDKRDAETFGADLMDMVQRYLTLHGQALANQFTAKAADLEGRIDALEQSVTGVNKRTTESLESQFYALLGKLVPDWEQVNDDDEWKTWLDERDPIYGARRQDALDSAHQRLDAQRVANVFNAYKATKPKPRQPDSLANQVAPTTVASAPAPVQAPQKPLVSQKFIQKFYNDLALGRYDKRKPEADRIEAEINAAVAEGRIV